jgi:serine/threonine-protein kinase RsbT
MMNSPQGNVSIEYENDIIAARRAARDMATRLSFGITDVTRIVTAASELARNILLYAGTGIMWCSTLTQNDNAGIELRFEDHGPGIPDIDWAMQPGHGTGHGLGLGLPGAKRLMDELDIHSEAGKGTTITVRKWLRR